MTKTICSILLCILLTAVSSQALEPFAIMEKNSSYFTESPGEVALMKMIQKTASGKVKKENSLIMAIKKNGEKYCTVIYVKDDGTLFFSKQSINNKEPINESWLYVPPIPGVKNSGKIFKVNQNALQQSFIGSDFYVVDLEQINIYDQESYRSQDGDALAIHAESKRYGERILRFDDAFNIKHVDYFKKGKMHKRSFWSDYQNHRARNIRMERLKQEEVYRFTEINAEYHAVPTLSDSVFDHSRMEGVKSELLAIEKMMQQ